MIINNLNTYGNSRSPEILAHAQTISNFFIDAIEQNDCNLKIVIGFYFELDDTMETAKGIADAIVLDNWNKPPLLSSTSGYNYINSPKVVLKTPEAVEEAVKAMKNRCFNCKLRLPKIKFEKDFRFVYNKLSIQLEVFKVTFPKLKKPNIRNYCHMSFALQKACIPDILKLIGMLLMAFSSIMALKKLPRISLGVFIKAIIGKLMASVVANIKLSIDMSQTGLPCILSAIEEIANAIPTKQDVYDLPMDDWIRDQLFPKEPYTTLSGKVKQPFVPRSVFIQTQDQLLSSKQITKEEYDKNLREYAKRNEPLRHYAKQLREQTNLMENRAQQKIDETFGKVSEVVTRAQDEVNAYIQSLLGVLDYFECESARSGPDFTEVIEYINQLQEVINFFSSVVGVWLVKLFKPLLCMDVIAHKDLASAIGQAASEPLSNADLAAIFEEFTGKQTAISSDGVSILIYDKPAKQMLPKLTLIGCNLKEFAEAHTVENLVPAIVDYITTHGDSSNTPRPPRGPGVKIIQDIGDIGVKVWSSPTISVPTTNYYKPIPVPIPKGIRDVPIKIHPTLTATVRKPTGTNVFIKPTPITVYPNIPPIRVDDPKAPPVKITPPTVKPAIPPGITIKVPPVVSIIDKIVTDTIGVNDPTMTIPIPTKPGTNDIGIPDEIDDLIDFIYNPPTETKPSDSEGSVDVTDYYNIHYDDLSEIKGKDISDTKEEKRSFQAECKTFEDVIDVLSTLKI